MANYGERIIEILGGVTASELSAVRSAAYREGYNDGNDDPVSGQLRTFSYRLLGGIEGTRDFSKVKRRDVLEAVWALYQTNPIARRIMSLKRDHIIGRNAVLSSEDKDLEEIILDFWSRNKMDRLVKEFCLQLFLLGEQCYPAFTRKADGAVKIGYIDPAQIDRVITHPDNALEVWAVALLGSFAIFDTWAGGDKGRRVYRIIREDEGAIVGGKMTPPKHKGLLITHEQATFEDWELPMLKEFGLTGYSGSCFYEKVNSVSNHPRGYSDLMQVADWIERAAMTLKGVANREKLSSYFFMHVTVEGDKEEVNYWKNEFRANPPQPLSMFVTNDKVGVDLKQPDLGQSGSISGFVALLTLIMGGVGYPLSWYGYGNDTNRSTLDKQADPTEKSLEHDQDLFKDFMLRILRFVRDQAIIAKHGKFDEDAKIDLALGEINAQNMAEMAGMFAPIMQAMIAGKDNGLVSEETAVSVVAKALAEVGQVVNVQDEMEKVKEEGDSKDEKEMEKRNGVVKEWLNGQGA